MLAMVLGCKRVDLYLRHDQPLKQSELSAFKALIKRRRQHEPMAYILGVKEFYGLSFAVGPGVLIPRPETEHLVEEALKRLPREAPSRVLDLCTGCGAVALTLAKQRPLLQVLGVDISGEALAYARRNAAAMGLEERADWRQGDLYDPVAAAGGFFDIITANPPYVAAEDWPGLPLEVREFEPRQALEGGPQGLEAVRAIIQGARAFLRPQGWLIIELGMGQAPAAASLARDAGIYESVHTAPDLAGIERVLVCQRGDYG
jgi:release factor glutamine methyltransferase